tara:strand:- start:433 stop:567 length:135 start_codon:yes stop_codon:yes gene_type:complete
MSDLKAALRLLREEMAAVGVVAVTVTPDKVEITRQIVQTRSITL